MSVYRQDYAELGANVQATPQGGIRVPGNVTRTGVLVYLTEDGKEVRELRHPEEVFANDSLKSLQGSTITRLHPDLPVTPLTWKIVAVGHVDNNVEQSGEFVGADLIIQDAQCIREIASEDLAELSAGYYCDLDMTPGTFNGERYDAIQRNIRYNHVAMGPKDWGRAGKDVALRLDSELNQIAPSGVRKDLNMRTKKNDEGVEEKDAEKTDEDMSVEDAMKMIEALTAERDALLAERDALAEDSGDEEQKEDTSDEDDEAAKKVVEDAIDARVSLIEDAKSILGKDVLYRGRSNREIMIDVIKADKSDFAGTKKTDTYVEAYFDACKARLKNQATANLRGGAPTATRNDAKPELSAQERMIERRKNLSRGSE